MPHKTIECFTLPRELEYMFSLAMGVSAQGEPTDLNWDRFSIQVDKNRLTPLVAAEIQKLPPETVSRYPALQEITVKHRDNTRRAVEQMQTLAFLMKDLTDLGIRVMSLKGPMLTIQLYGNPAMRLSRDLDILVPEADLPRAAARLEELGFEENVDVFHKTPKRRADRRHGGEEMHRVYTRGHICVELHWRLTFRYDQSFDDLWNGRSVKKLLGQDIFCLGAGDELIYLICHGAGHGFSRLRWLVDLYELLRAPEVDLLVLYSRMKAKGVQTLLLETLLLLFLLPEFSFPAVSNDLFSIEREGNKIRVSYAVSCREDFRLAFSLVSAVYPLMLMSTEARGMTERKYMQMLPSVNKKKNLFTRLWAIMQPCAADLKRFDFPDRLYFLYYVVRPFYKLWRMTPFYHADE